VEPLELRETPSASAAAPLPTIPQSGGSVRVAELAYDGTPTDATEAQLLHSGVDLVVSGTSNQGAIAAAAPNTPQLAYTNLSNLYGSLLINWLNYAQANGLNPEDAFYHVTTPTPFSGSSPSSQPVDWFWAVYQGGGNTWTDYTSQAHNGAPGNVPFASVGDSLAVGYAEPFMELNVSLASGAGAGYSYAIEYPTAVDASGTPTAWGTIQPKTDTTAGLTHSGTITFDPPSNWVPASLNGSAGLYYVRIRATSAGTAPVATSIRGQDYTNSGDGTTGVIPVFDFAADTNHDGYLNDAEYAVAVKAGDYARFAYQSRLFAPGYGQMRFATDPGNPSFDTWAVQYEANFLQSRPLDAGLFVDNSSGIAPASPGQVVESVATYSADYAALLTSVGQAIAPHWILPNTGGGGSSAKAVIQATGASFEENALQPLAGNYQQFESLASQVAAEEAATSPSPYLVLDSAPTGGSPTDPRTQLATLAEYYLMAQPNTTFLDFYGGYAPASSWSEHWSPAAAYNIGMPTGDWSLAQTGADPSLPSLTYRVYERQYSNALVLYKPLSYGNGVSGTTADSTATTFNLNGTYYPLRADGTLGAPVTSVSLRNGEGAILVKAPSAGPGAVPAASASPAALAVSGLPSSVGPGQTVTFTVTAKTASGNVATGYTGTVHFRSSDPGAVLPADYTFTAADKGVHTFSVTFGTAGPQIVMADDAAQPTVAGSAGLTVGQPAATQFAIKIASPPTAGQPDTVTVTAVDAYGNAIPGYQGTVHFSSTDLAAVLPGDYTFSAADHGSHTFAVTLNTAGPEFVRVTDTEAPAVDGITGLTVATA
jgi:hypothetical protein